MRPDFAQFRQFGRSPSHWTPPVLAHFPRADVKGELSVLGASGHCRMPPGPMRSLSADEQSAGATYPNFPLSASMAGLGSPRNTHHLGEYLISTSALALDQ